MNWLLKELFGDAIIAAIVLLTYIAATKLVGHPIDWEMCRLVTLAAFSGSFGTGSFKAFKKWLNSDGPTT